MTTLKKLDGHDLADPRDVLKLHGITVWTAKDIKAYQKAQVRVHTNWAGYIQAYMPLDFAPKVLVATAVCLLLAVLGVGVGLYFNNWLMFWSTFSIGVVLVLLLKYDDMIEARSAVWSYTLATPRNVTPAFAAAAWETAKKLYPGCHFYVAELRDTINYGLLDPILFMTMDKHSRPHEGIALEVWGEQGQRVPPPDWK